MSGKNLVIVESPHKADTIQKYLDRNEWTVKASVGHIRDLEEHSLSVDVANGFQPNYVIPSDKKRVVAELKKMAAEAQTVWLASDEDREGEAIAWHLREVLGIPSDKTRRISYQEITKTAFMDALAHPRDIDMNLVNAQQARRVLDRLVGFELSPILWRKIQPKLSAGRVQSVALRLIVDREREIMAFTPEPYYRVEAVFTPEGGKTQVKALLDTHFATEADVRKFLEDSIGANYSIVSIERKEATRTPAAPFTTSTLQQEAARKLRFPIATTMRLAQSLYERGLITYMRTDSTNLSSLALGTAKKYILQHFGETYYHYRQYKTKSKGAQEAHEAIRPTYIDNVSIEGTPQEKKLYELIWKRTVASQMADSRLMGTTLKVASDRRPELYGIQASELIFDGFMKMYLESRDEDEVPEAEDVLLPRLSKGDRLEAREVNAQCKFTVAPPRYSEATLVKKLEELEIGRPSTYQSIIGTLTTGRGYVTKGDKDGQRIPVTNLTLKGSAVKASQKSETVGAEKGKLLPQEIGLIVAGFLVDNFTDILDYDFTARVEADFDQVALGKKAWNRIIESFYTPFHRHVDEVMQERGYTGKVTREIGVAPDGDRVIASFGKFGPYVQKGDGARRQSASLAKGQLIETITLEQALKLLKLPRIIGQIDGVDVVALRGKFGPYLKYGSKNVKLPRSADPLTISLEECERLVRASEAENAAPEYIHEWGDIKVMKGRFGPYIKQGAVNYKIPRGKDAATLTEADCQAIIAAGEPTKKFAGKRRK